MTTLTVTTVRGSWGDIRNRINLLRRTNFFSGCKASPDLTFSNIDVRRYVGDIAKPRGIPELAGRTLAMAYYHADGEYRHGPVVDTTGMTAREADVAAVQALCDFYNNEPDAERLSELKIRARKYNLVADEKHGGVLYSGNNTRPFRYLDSTGLQFNTDYEMAVALIGLPFKKAA